MLSYSDVVYYICHEYLNASQAMVVQKVMKSRKIQLFCGQSKLFHFDKIQNLFDFHILPKKCILDICNSRKVLQSLKIENKFNKKKCCPKQIFLYHFHVQKDSESDDCWQPLDTKIVLHNF